MHSHYYVENTDFRDKNVLVVGIGNSAMDIAVESSFVARKTFLSSRRGAYILPKYLFGRPLDQIGVNALTPILPFAFRRAILMAMYRIGVGKVSGLRAAGARPPPRRGAPDDLGGLPQSDRPRRHDLEAERPALEGGRVSFEDGSTEEIDVIVWCTGYKVTFPFFDEDFMSAPDNDLPLFRRVFKPGIDNLAFIGLLQPLGAIMPLAEAQGRWLAAYLRGEYQLPSAPADGGRHPSRARDDVQALRRVEAPHDAGRLRQLPLRARQGAEGGRRAGPGGRLPAAGGAARGARQRCAAG